MEERGIVDKEIHLALRKSGIKTLRTERISLSKEGERGQRMLKNYC